MKCAAKGCSEVSTNACFDYCQFHSKIIAQNIMLGLPSVVAVLRLSSAIQGPASIEGLCLVRDKSWSFGVINYYESSGEWRLLDGAVVFDDEDIPSLIEALSGWVEKQKAPIEGLP